VVLTGRLEGALIAVSVMDGTSAATVETTATGAAPRGPGNPESSPW
jgi:hypothetical protein